VVVAVGRCAGHAEPGDALGDTVTDVAVVLTWMRLVTDVRQADVLVLAAVDRVAGVEGAGVIVVAGGVWPIDAGAVVTYLPAIADRAVVTGGTRQRIVEAARQRVATVVRAGVRVAAVGWRAGDALTERVAGLVPVADITVRTRRACRR